MISACKNCQIPLTKQEVEFIKETGKWCPHCSDEVHRQYKVWLPTSGFSPLYMGIDVAASDQDKTIETVVKNEDGRQTVSSVRELV